ncbi:glucose-6-phosphate dehydrogenase assembly protein OpcA [Tessaracoccus bendigoensis DSM 12906]|uniref:Glucose-6-phosphate dehydrogenase assembly protein OpcA n=1 Tax=Tessaracoccus bendigoensis DSM 12906 TaxID=1123357 RepID=A0A1M6IDH4_9ACTN|nr:glucose-6-phosphate dehydrogenase assembly protein OpcA [Tessaracoccus bendigoensis]SHJ32518.1 glucose-6-phosphate dehydrogenase assembly protein OpcA [Tessaracoccus bendigoensis DSM 12906]
MIVELKNTTSRAISAALVDAHRGVGSASGLVLTLVIVTGESRFSEVLEAAKASATAHPSRVIVATFDDGSESGLDATVEVGEGLPGDLIVLRLHGDLRHHGDSVCLPLLLPDSPTIVWWPHESPENLATDPIGSLADRRITDAAGCGDPVEALLRRARHHTPGDTDLAWTRLTRWRSLLAAALDQTRTQVTDAVVSAAPDNAPALLLIAWLKARLGVPVTYLPGDLPGVNSVVLSTTEGDISVRRFAEGRALYQVPGQPERTVALRRRPLTDLLTEELGRMDADDVFESAAAQVVTDAGER